MTGLILSSPSHVYRGRGVTRYMIGEFGVALALAGVVVGYRFWRKAPELSGAAWPHPGVQPQSSRVWG